MLRVSCSHSPFFNGEHGWLAIHGYVSTSATMILPREVASGARCGPVPFATRRQAPVRQRDRIAPSCLATSSPRESDVMTKLWQQAARPLAAGLLAASLLLAPPALAAGPVVVTLSDDTPVADLARVVPSGKLAAVQQQLLDLERDTGWRVRVLTLFDRSTAPSVEQIRSEWHVDDKTVVVLVDPTSPNILSFKYGLAVQREVLPRPFFTELQVRRRPKLSSHSCVHCLQLPAPLLCLCVFRLDSVPCLLCGTAGRQQPCRAS